MKDVLQRNMKNTVSITQSEQANWLYKADHHYLSARLLFLHNLIFSGEENAGFALELLIKCGCKMRNVKYKNDHNKSDHKITELWKKLKPPFSLDEGYTNYLKHLERVMYHKHPDTWDVSITRKDDYGMLDLLYLKLRKWVVESIPENERLPTELDYAIKNQEVFDNATSRHGAWSLSTILKRSNSQYILL